MHFNDHLEDFAKEFAGNWKKFESFAWSHWRFDIEDPENWGIFYTHNRDSRLLDLSNASVIEKEMESFVEDGTAISESHNHWACGWIDGFSVRVYDENRNITEACKKICELKMAMEEYPILDEEDYSQREHEASIEAISQICHSFVKDELIDSETDWVGEVSSWLWENNESEMENRDDQGAYPSDEACKEALEELGYLDPDLD